MGNSNEFRQDAPPALAGSLAYLLTVATRHAVRRAQLEFGDEELRFAHYIGLTWIDHSGPCSQRALASAMAVDPSDLTGLLNELEERGLVRRTIDPSDHRRNLLTITDAGTAWLTARRGRANAFDRRLGGPLADGGAALRAELASLIGEGSA